MITLGLLFASLVFAQQKGTVTPEVHPALPMSVCDTSGCQDISTSVVLDANWRWLHNVGGYKNCYTGTAWDAQYCPDPVTCAKNCALDGADYVKTYGITTSGKEMTLGYVIPSGDVGSRTFLMDPSGDKYHMFMLKNREFSVTVDASQLPCGLNGALYFVEMDADGGASRFPGNAAGATFGTGYCDAQCPHDIKFINGEANLLEWSNTTAMGKYGTCCTEMDIVETNTISHALTAHPCTVDGQQRCTGADCGGGSDRYNGVCDMDGCDFNSWRNGNQTFYGAGSSFKLDASKPYTVTTAFITADGTDSGDLTEIKRTFTQNGVSFSFPGASNIDPSMHSITDAYCTKSKLVFKNTNDFQTKGSLKRMGDVMEKGLVLVMSIWDDAAAHMLWLDSNYPTTSPVSQPGISRGSCPITSGVPADVRKNFPHATVKWSNLKMAPISN